MQTTCKEIFNLFNWGKSYEKLRKAFDDLDISMRSFVNFQATRFANSVRFVFINWRKDYHAVVVSLANFVERKVNSSNADDRDKVEGGKVVKRTINSWDFCLSLSGCSDIHDLYGAFPNVCQEVDLRPYERYDRAHALISMFLTMMKSIHHSDCPVL